MAAAKEAIKVVLVGDRAVGKTGALYSYFTNALPEKIPHREDAWEKEFLVDEIPIRQVVFDTRGDESYDRGRSNIYPGTDIFLVCYRITNRQTLFNARSKWVPDIQHHCPGRPFILVGLAVDCRDDREANPHHLGSIEDVTTVTTVEAEHAAQEMQAAGLVECSASTQKNLKLVFDTATRVHRKRNGADGKKSAGIECATM